VGPAFARGHAPFRVGCRPACRVGQTHRMLTEKHVAGLRVLSDDDAAAQGVLVAFLDRDGGVSSAPYDSLNLAARVGDDLHDVEVNRRRAGAALGFDPAALVLARQVHGAEVLTVGPEDAGVIGEGDVLMTSSPGRVLGILTADCVPVVLWGDKGIALAHAGWRGLVGGALEAAVAALGDVRKAWVGPSIHACCYEVGPEVIDAFAARGLPVAAPDRVDPGQAAVALLERAGIADVEATSMCTSSDPRYFSYRRDGITGRQGAFAGLLGTALPGTPR
jgi:polyphenol oxidase